MSRPLYRLDARRFTGSLAEPGRNDTESHESDDRVALTDKAWALCADGYETWLYEWEARARPSTAVEGGAGADWVLRLIDHRRPTGTDADVR